MKYIVLLSLILLSDFAFGQKGDLELVKKRGHEADTVATVSATDPDSNVVFKIVEYMPEYPGGEMEMMNFIQKNIQYPTMEKENDIQGRVLVKFVVNRDGSLSDIAIYRSPSPGLGKEALRLVNLLSKFKPGMQQGRAVRVEYMLPITFKLPAQEPVK